MSAGARQGPTKDRVLDVPAFRRYLVLRTVAMLGGVVSLVAFPVLVYQLTGRASLTALMAVAESLPYLLVGLPAGALVDRWHRRRVIVLTGLASGALMVTIPAADLLASLVFAHVLAVGTAVATLWVFADAATFGVLPQMVGRSHVASATSMLVTISTVIGLGRSLPAAPPRREVPIAEAVSARTSNIVQSSSQDGLGGAILPLRRAVASAHQRAGPLPDDHPDSTAGGPLKVAGAPVQG